MKAKQKEGNDEKDVIEEETGKENVNCKDETDDLQVCDKTSCTNSANKKCSRYITITTPTTTSTIIIHIHMIIIKIIIFMIEQGAAWFTTARSSA